MLLILGDMTGEAFEFRKFSRSNCQKPETIAAPLCTERAHPAWDKMGFCKICVFYHPNILQNRKKLAKNVAFFDLLCYNVAALK